MKIKQVIIMRMKYPDGKGGTFSPRKGKLIAQGAHASMKVFFDKFNITPRFEKDGFTACLAISEEEKQWIEGSFTKICLSVDSEEELISIYNQAKSAGLLCSLIEDNGLTEFHGVKTKTAVAIGPANSDEIDKITRELKLL